MVRSRKLRWVIHVWFIYQHKWLIIPVVLLQRDMTNYWSDLMHLLLQELKVTSYNVQFSASIDWNQKNLTWSSTYLCCFLTSVMPVFLGWLWRATDVESWGSLDTDWYCILWQQVWWTRISWSLHTDHRVYRLDTWEHGQVAEGTPVKTECDEIVCLH